MKKALFFRRAAALSLSLMLLNPVSAAAEGANSGYGVRELTVWENGETALQLTGLLAELDFASAGDVAGIRLHVNNADGEVASIAASEVDGLLLVELHGALSGQTVKYTADPDVLTLRLNEQLSGSMGSSADADVPDSTAGTEPDTENGELPELPETEPEETEGEELAEGVSPVKQFFDQIPLEDAISGLESLTDTLKKTDLFLDTVEPILTDSLVDGDRMEVAGRECAAHGMSIDAEHAAQILDALSVFGLEDLNAALAEKDLKIEGGSLLWGEDAGWMGAEAAFGMTENGETGWLRGRCTSEGDEAAISGGYFDGNGNFINGYEIKAAAADPNEDVSWLPTDTAGAIDLTAMEPEEAMEQISSDMEMLSSDLMQGIMPVLMESMNLPEAADQEDAAVIGGADGSTEIELED